MQQPTSPSESTGSSSLHTAADSKSAQAPGLGDARPKYGSRGRASKAITLSLLVAFALGARSPHLEAARVAPAKQKPLSEAEILKLVHSYKPIDMKDSCTLNGLLFQDWFEVQVPGGWISQQNITLIAADGGKLHHRVTLFAAGEDYYAFDHNVGVVRIKTKATEADRPQLIADAQRDVREARFGGSRQVSTETLFFKNFYQEMYQRFKGHRPVAVVRYHDHEALAFDEPPQYADRGIGNTTVYAIERGSMSAHRKSPSVASSTAAGLILQAFFRHKDTSIKIVVGDLDATRTEQIRATHRFP